MAQTPVQWLFGIDPQRAIPDTADLQFTLPPDEFWTLAAIAAGVAALVYVCGIYRRESRALGGMLSGILTVLRVLAIAVAVIVLLRPRLEWKVPQPLEEDDKGEPEPPAVIFLIDESRSMGVADADKETPEELASELAKALGYASSGDVRGKTRLRLVQEAFGKEAEALAAEIRNGRSGRPAPVNKVQVFAFAADPRELFNEPFTPRRKPKDGEAAPTSEPAPEPAEAALARVAAELRLRKLAAFPDPRDPDNRLITVESVRDLKDAQLTGVKEALADLAKLPADKPAGEKTGDKLPKDLAAAIEKARDTLEGRRGETNLGGSLRGVLADKGYKVTAVVLVSDGRNNGLDLKAAEQLAKQNRIPIHTIGVGNERAAVNLQLVNVLAAESPRKNEPFNLRFLFGHVGLADKTVEFEVRRRPIKTDDKGKIVPGSEGAWSAVPGPQPVQVSRDSTVQEVGLTTKSEDVGEFEYEVKARVADAAESKLDDNTKTVRVRVLDDRVKVLLVAGDPSWEYRALKNLLIRSTSLRASILLQNCSADFSQEASIDDAGDRDMPVMRVTRLPRSREKLSKYDVIILFDPAFTTARLDEDSADRRISPDWCEVVNELVTDRGVGLVYMAGIKNTPLLFDERAPDQADVPLFKALQDLLPVIPEKFALRLIRGISVSYPALVTEKEGRFHPVLRFIDKEKPEEALQANSAIWDRLPRIFWAMPVRQIQPAAKVLLEQNHPVYKVGDQNLPLLVEQQSGVGRSLYFGFDSTWRWRFLGDSVFNEFWVRTIKYVVEGRRMGGRSRVQLITDGKPFYKTNEPLELVAELLDKRYGPLKLPEVELTLTRLPPEGKTPDGPPETAEVRLTPVVGGNGGRYRGMFVPQKPGKWEVSIKPQDPLPADENLVIASEYERPILEVASLDKEMRNFTADFNELKRLAAETKGTFLPIGQLGKLADGRIRDLKIEHIRTGRAKPPKEEVQTLWDAPVWLILFALLLITEWGVRKWKNLA